MPLTEPSAMKSPVRIVQSGFTIIEVMVAIALGLVILAALTTFFVNTSATQRELERTSRQIENGRYALDTLSTEVRLAAFYAELSQVGATYTAPDPCQTALANLGLSMSPLNVPLAVFGYAADAPALPACITDRVPNTDVLVIRRFGTEMVPAASAAANQVYVQTSRCNTDSTATPWAVGYGQSASFTLRNTACSGPDSVYQFRVEIFYVRTYSDTPGDGIPTLVKIELDKQALRTSPLVEGIRLLRISYGVDNDLDGTPDVYSRCDTTSPCAVAQWNNVTAIKLTLLSENIEDSRDYVDTKTYTLDGYTPPVYNDHRKRHVYGSTVSVLNRTGPREN
jgi:type IV pilus assembly protein PilW